MRNRPPAHAPALPARQVQLAEGGVLTLHRCVGLHVHVRIDDPTSVFGLAMAVDRNVADNSAHLWEHMVMRDDGSDGELITSFELNCSRRWWQALTAYRSISFAVGSYTTRCMYRSALSLSLACFRLELDPQRMETETTQSSGRMSIENSAPKGVRAMVLQCASRALLGVMPEDEERIPTIEQLYAWHDTNIWPESALWFTYGRMPLSDAVDMVQSLHAAVRRRGIEHESRRGSQRAGLN